MSPIDDATVRDQAAAYALGALPPDEVPAFETAMAHDPAIAALVAEFRELAALIARSPGVASSRPELKSRVLARVASEKVHRLPAADPESGRDRRGAWLAAAAVLLMGAAALLAWNLAKTRSELARIRTDLAIAQDSLAAQTLTLGTLLGGGEALTVVRLSSTGAQPPGMQLFWNRRAGRGVLHAYGLPPAPPGRVYQLWLIRDGVPVPSQLFNSGPDGEVLVTNFALPSGEGVTAAAVTEEPAGGSPQPTSPILLLGALPAS